MLLSAAVSSLASASEDAAPGGSRATQNSRALRLSVGANRLMTLAIATALAVVVFVTKGGQDLSSATWTEIVLTILGAAAAIAVLLFGAAGRRYGAVTLTLFALLATLTALSIAWSVQPDNSWLEANRTLSYLAVFGSGMALARLLPERWPALLGALALFSLVVAGYALLVKVFPETFAPQETLGRLRAPFDYWNATGLIGAFGLPAWLWVGARSEARASRALAPPAIAVLVTVIVLSYSRSAVLAAVAGVGLWFALAPVRLRGALVLGIGLAGARNSRWLGPGDARSDPRPDCTPLAQHGRPRFRHRARAHAAARRCRRARLRLRLRSRCPHSGDPAPDRDRPPDRRRSHPSGRRRRTRDLAAWPDG